MKAKLALFLFACGISASAMAARDNCAYACYYDYNACVASGAPRWECEDEKWRCLSWSCGLEQP